MEKYKVKLREIREKELIVEAASEEMAKQSVLKQYDQNQILLTMEDVVDRSVEIRDILTDYDISQFT